MSKCIYFDATEATETYLLTHISYAFNDEKQPNTCLSNIIQNKSYFRR